MLSIQCVLSGTVYGNDAFVIQRVDNDCDDFVSKVVIAIFPLGYGRTWCHWKLALLDVLKRVANPIVFVGTRDVLSFVIVSPIDLGTR